MIVQRNLNDIKFPQVSRTLLSILADLNSSIVSIFPARPPISNFSLPLTKPLETIPTAPITTDVMFILTLFSTFLVLRQGLSTCLSFRFLWFKPSDQPGQQSLIYNRFSFFLLIYFYFLLIISWSGLQAEIRWSVCISKSQRILCVSFSRTGSVLCIYHFFVWSNSCSCTIPSGSPFLPTHV